MVVAAKGMTELSGGVNINRNPTLQVAWAFESCARLITGGIKVWVLGLMPERCLRRQQAAGSRNSRGSDYCGMAGIGRE